MVSCRRSDVTANEVLDPGVDVGVFHDFHSESVFGALGIY